MYQILINHVFLKKYVLTFKISEFWARDILLLSVCLEWSSYYWAWTEGWLIRWQLWLTFYNLTVIFTFWQLCQQLGSIISDIILQFKLVGTGNWVTVLKGCTKQISGLTLKSIFIFHTLGWGMVQFQLNNVTKKLNHIS